MPLDYGKLFCPTLYLSPIGDRVNIRYGSVLIASGEVEPGTVFIVMMAVMSGSQSLGNTGPQLTALAGARGAAGVIFDIIDAVS